MDFECLFSHRNDASSLSVASKVNWFGSTEGYETVTESEESVIATASYTVTSMPLGAALSDDDLTALNRSTTKNLNA
jgi:hypothetical protein